MRAHNERLVLSLVRQYKSLAKSDIARLTGLSAQTVSVIMRELESEGLLLRHAPNRGRIGQPSIPLGLNPDGAFFLGLKIGRRSADLVLIDFVGSVRGMLGRSYAFPTPEETLSFVREGIGKLRAGLGEDSDRRLAGLGIAMPFELWNWADTIGAPKRAMDGWRTVAIRQEIQEMVPFPVYLQNDATAACGAELVFGTADQLRNFIYFYIGSFAGGGIVLNGSLYGGATGNAGAVGSIPVPGRDGKPTQLIDVASLAVLEQALRDKGIDGNFLWTSPDAWQEIGPLLDQWVASSAKALAYAIVSACAVIDFEAAMIDGWMPPAIRARIVREVGEVLSTVDTEGIELPAVREGTVGSNARALGGASLPLAERFLVGFSAPQRDI